MQHEQQFVALNSIANTIRLHSVILQCWNLWTKSQAAVRKCWMLVKPRHKYTLNSQRPLAVKFIQSNTRLWLALVGCALDVKRYVNVVCVHILSRLVGGCEWRESRIAHEHLYEGHWMSEHDEFIVKSGRNIRLHALFAEQNNVFEKVQSGICTAYSFSDLRQLPTQNSHVRLLRFVSHAKEAIKM